MNWNPIARRHFLQGAGKAALILPVLPSLLPRRAQAQAIAGKQKSFIGFPIWNHVHYQYNASEAEARTTPSVYMPPFINMKPTAIPGKHTIYSKSLLDAKNDNPAGRISEIIDASFNSMLPKMLFVQGMDYLYTYGHHSGQFGNGHCTANTTIAAECPAIGNLETVLAYSANFYKNAALKGKYVHFTGSSVDVRLGSDYYASTYTYANPADRLTSAMVNTSPIVSPAVLWDKFFGQFTPPPTKAGAKDPRQTLVDRVIGDYRAVLGGSRLGADDRRRIERHVQLLQETQKNLTAGGAMCTKPARPTTSSDIKATVQAHNDVIVSLIACGLCHSFLGKVMAFVANEADAWHRWSHDEASYGLVKRQIQAVNRDAALDLARKLDAQGLLDDSLIVLPSEHGRKGHIGLGASVVMFGSAGGVLKTGQYVDYRDMATGDDGQDPNGRSRSGYPYNQLWANILMAMGMPPSEFEPLNRTSNSFFNPGNSGYGSNLFTSYTNGAPPTGYGPKFRGHNLSEWLPLIKA